MTEETATKQKEPPTPQIVGSNLLADLVEVMEEMEFMACLDGRVTFYRKLDPILERAKKHLKTQGTTVADSEARNRPFFRG